MLKISRWTGPAVRLGLSAALFAAFSCMVPMPTAKADYFDQRTVVTLDRPLEVPGSILPPGKYVFKLFDSNAERTVVQVFDWSTHRLVTSFIGFPASRVMPTRHTILRFEPASNNSDVLREWFYPGENYGLVFTYH